MPARGTACWTVAGVEDERDRSHACVCGPSPLQGLGRWLLCWHLLAGELLQHGDGTQTAPIVPPAGRHAPQLCWF